MDVVIVVCRQPDLPHVIGTLETFDGIADTLDRRQSQDLPPLKRWAAALRRSGYLFMLAFLFRLQLWVFAYPQSPWTAFARARQQALPPPLPTPPLK